MHFEYKSNTIIFIVLYTTHILVSVFNNLVTKIK
jgi:hypothetical protein